MRTKTVHRYYCEHCSKGGFKKPNMAQHELGCTRNPNRLCYLCGNANTFDLKAIIEELKKRHPVSADDISSENLAWVREKTGDCPACILAALRQADLYAWEQFDYKEEVRAWHLENSREMRDLLL